MARRRRKHKSPWIRHSSRKDGGTGAKPRPRTNKRKSKKRK